MSKRDDIPSMRRRTSTGKFHDFFAGLKKNKISHTSDNSDSSLKNSHKKNDRSHLKIIKAPSSRKMVTIAVITGFLAVVISLMFVISVLSPISFVESTRNFFAGIGASGSFPVELSVSSRNDIKKMGNDVVLVTDSNINLYTSGGGKIFSRQHGYSNPRSITSDSRVLTFDSGTNEYRIDNRYENVYSGTTDNAILCAAMARNGVYALNTYSSKYICETTVYSADFIPLFRWNSAEQHITSIALSSNGKQLAVGSVGAVEGKYISTVRIFNINSTEAILTKEFSDKMILAVNYNVDGTWSAVFENSYVTLFNDRDPIEISFDEGDVSCLDLSNNTYDLLIITNYNDQNHNRVLVVESNGTIVKDIVFDKTVVSCSVSDNYVFLLSKGKVTRMDIEGDDVLETEVPADCMFALESGKNVITVNTGHLSKSSF